MHKPEPLVKASHANALWSLCHHTQTEGVKRTDLVFQLDRCKYGKKLSGLCLFQAFYNILDHFKERQIFLLKEKLNHLLSIIGSDYFIK